MPKMPTKKSNPYQIAAKISTTPPSNSSIVTNSLIKKFKSEASQKDRDMVGAIVKLNQATSNNMNGISGSVANIEKSLEDTRKDIQKIGPKGGVEEITKSTESILTKLGYTIDNLSKGVKQIMIDTAKGTKETLAAYSRAISEDISVNKQNVVAMALARTSPIFGYFVSKFVETGVFKRAASRIGGLLSSPFRKREPGGEEFGIPHMQHGGYVKKGGTAMLHSAEVVMPIDKLLERIDERYREGREQSEKNSKKRMTDWFKLWSRYSLNLTTRTLKRERVSKRSLFGSFIGGLREEFQTTELPALERIATEITELREATIKSSSTLEKIGYAWRTALYEHPMFRSMIGLVKTYTKTITFPWKVLFKTRGGYGTDLPKAGRNIFQNIASILGTIYIGMMWKADEILNRLDILVNQSGGKVPGRRIKAPGEWSIAGRTLGLVAKPFELIARKVLPETISEELSKERQSFKQTIGGLISASTKTARIGLAKIPRFKGLGISKAPAVLTIEDQMLLEQQRTSGFLLEVLEHFDDPRKFQSQIEQSVEYAITKAHSNFGYAIQLYGPEGFISGRLLPKIKPGVKMVPPSSSRFLKQIMIINDKQLVEQKKSKKTFLDKLMWLPMLLIGFFKTKLIPSFLRIPSLLWKYMGPVLTPIGRGILLLANKFGITGLFKKMLPLLKSPAFAKLTKGAGLVAGAAGVAEAGYEAYKGVKRAGEIFGVEKATVGQKVAAGLGSFLGGAGPGGMKGAVSGLRRGAQIGMGIGTLFGGPVGTAIGGGIGALAGGILGFIGGDKISKGLAYIGTKTKDLVKGIWGWIKYIFTLPGKVITKMGTIIKDKWKETSGSIPIKIMKMAGWFLMLPYTLTIKGMKWIGTYLGRQWTKFSKWIGPSIGKAVFKIVSWPFDTISWIAGKALDGLKELIGWDKMKLKYKPLFDTFEFIGGILSKIKGYVVEKMKGIPGIGGLIKWYQTHKEESITDKVLIAKYDFDKNKKAKEIQERIKKYSETKLTSDLKRAGLSDREIKKRIRELKKSDIYEKAMKLASQNHEKEAMKTILEYSKQVATSVKKIEEINKETNAKIISEQQRTLISDFWKPRISEKTKMIGDYYTGKKATMEEYWESESDRYSIKEKMGPIVSRTQAMLAAAGQEINQLKNQIKENKKVIESLKNIQQVVVNNVNDVKNAVTSNASNTVEGGGSGVNPDQLFAGSPRSTWTEMVLNGEL